MSPTPPRGPSALTAVLLLARLGLVQARRDRTVLIGLALSLLPALGAGVALASGNADHDFFNKLLHHTLRLLVPFVMALLASGAVAGEVEQKTITYLFTRPLPRWTLPLGKYLGALVPALGGLLLGLGAAYLLCLAGEPDELLPRLPEAALGLGAVALGALHFGAVACAFGTLFCAYPFVAMVLYLLVFDVGAALVPGYLKALSMGVHLTVLAGTYTPSTTMMVADPRITPPAALAVLLFTTAVWLALALLWVGRAEYRTDR